MKTIGTPKGRPRSFANCFYAKKEPGDNDPPLKSRLKPKKEIFDGLSSPDNFV
jgi:hypothetical protein